MSDKPKVSVIIPVYNEENYIQECLDSLINQTLKDIEIICVDDGSTDNSLSILKKYEEQDSRIRVIAERNRHAGVARNFGMQCAKGDYLSFLDADDVFDTNYLKSLSSFADQYMLDIALCQYDKFDTQTGNVQRINFDTFFKHLPVAYQKFSPDEIPDKAIFQLAVGWAWDKLFRREFIEQLNIYFSDFYSSNDGFFVHAAMCSAESIGFLKQNLISHRINNSQSISNNREKTWTCGFQMWKDIYTFLSRQNLLSKYSKSFFSAVAGHCVWQINTLYTIQAVRGCYQEIRKLEDQWQILAELDTTYIGAEEIEAFKDIVSGDLDAFLFKELQKSRKLQLYQSRTMKWAFPYERVPKGSRIILYGTGEVGRQFQTELKQADYCEILCFADQNYKETVNIAGTDVVAPKDLPSLKFDFLVISVKTQKVSDIIRKFLIDEGIDERKIVALLD